MVCAASSLSVSLEVHVTSGSTDRRSGDWSIADKTGHDFEVEQNPVPFNKKISVAGLPRA